MKTVKKTLCTFAAAALLLTACQPDKKRSPQEATPAVSLVCETITPPDEDMPRASVYAQVGQTRIKVADITVCVTITPDEYATHQIPTSATSAAGGFYAGAGTYLYTLVEDGVVRIMQGSVEEMQIAQSYGYVPIATIDKGRYAAVEADPPLFGLYALPETDGTWLLLLDEEDGRLKAEYVRTATPLDPEEEMFLDLEALGMTPFETMTLDADGRSLQTDWGAATVQFTENGPRLTFADKTGADGQPLSLVYVRY